MSPARYPLRHSACFMTIGVETKNFYPCKARVQKKTLVLLASSTPKSARARSPSHRHTHAHPPLGSGPQRARALSRHTHTHPPLSSGPQRARSRARCRGTHTHTPHLGRGPRQREQQVSEGGARGKQGFGFRAPPRVHCTRAPPSLVRVLALAPPSLLGLPWPY